MPPKKDNCDGEKGTKCKRAPSKWNKHVKEVYQYYNTEATKGGGKRLDFKVGLKKAAASWDKGKKEVNKTMWSNGKPKKIEILYQL